MPPGVLGEDECASAEAQLELYELEVDFTAKPMMKDLENAKDPLDSAVAVVQQTQTRLPKIF